MNQAEAKEKYGKRIQRCSGCYGAFYLKDMWLGEAGNFYCQSCKDDDMFHFDEFTSKMDLTKLPSLQEDADESTQCQNPFTRQV
ncbi:MAG TPA: hypothetical protein VE398_19585 [Acidobacteriota bacterium]|nr:hypothetical protein [Acidobacteriota bacterium]